MSVVRIAWVMIIGGFTGLLGGLFGKGGSAIATPLLHAAGVKAFASVASPLPATIPATTIAAFAYHRARSIDWDVVRTTAMVGVPATVMGAIATRWLGGATLIVATDVVVALLGARMLMSREGHLASRTPSPVAVPVAVPVVVGGERPQARPTGAPEDEPTAPEGTGPCEGSGASGPAVALVATIVGLASGLLGNSGGFLLAPLFATVLHIPLKRALGTSLAAAAVLAVPGTVVHGAMGHIDWSVTAAFGLASIPLSAYGARLALRTPTARLETIYGVALILLGVAFLALV